MSESPHVCVTSCKHLERCAGGELTAHHGSFSPFLSSLVHIDGERERTSAVAQLRACLMGMLI